MSYNQEIDSDPKFLVLKRKTDTKYYPGMWQVIKGKIEQGENPEQTALREVNEETGRDIKNLWHIPYLGSFYDTRIKAIQINSSGNVLYLIINTNFKDDNSELKKFNYTIQ